MSEKKQLEEKFAQLSDLKFYIESFPFQEFIMKPIFKELDELKSAYDCETIKELNTLKGKKKGLMKIIEVLKQVDSDWNNTKYELEQMKQN